MPGSKPGALPLGDGPPVTKVNSDYSLFAPIARLKSSMPSVIFAHDARLLPLIGKGVRSTPHDARLCAETLTALRARERWKTNILPLRG